MSGFLEVSNSQIKLLVKDYIEEGNPAEVATVVTLVLASAATHSDFNWEIVAKFARKQQLIQQRENDEDRKPAAWIKQIKKDWL